MINPVIIKIAVCVLVIKEIWLLLKVPSIENAVISFTTVGAIPGTTTTLTPTQTVGLLCGLFVVASLLIFNRELRHGLRRLFNRPARMPRAPLAVAPLAPLKLTLPIGPRRSSLFTRVWKILSMRTMPVVRHVGRASRWFGMLLVQRSISLWRWLKPYLEQFDKWLERKAHENTQMSFLLAMSNEILITVSGWLEAMRNHPATGKLVRK